MATVPPERAGDTPQIGSSRAGEMSMSVQTNWSVMIVAAMLAGIAGNACAGRDQPKEPMHEGGSKPDTR